MNKTIDKIILILVVFISILLVSLSLAVLLTGPPSEKHTSLTFVRPYGKPVIGETYTFSGKKYVFKKGTVIIAPTQWGNFLILKH